jgi:hypothetical protein
MVSGEKYCSTIEGRLIDSWFQERFLNHHGILPQQMMELKTSIAARFFLNARLSSPVFNAVAKSIVIRASKPNRG